VGRRHALGATTKVHQRHWRDLRTATGRRPVKDFLDELSDEEVASIGQKLVLTF
jgi:hypothetical protein